MASSHFISAETLASRLKRNKPTIGEFDSVIRWENIVRDVATFFADKYEGFDIDGFYEMCDYDFIVDRHYKFK